MDRQEIIRMAREAGIDAESDTLCRYEGWVEPLQRFAALVAAAERQRQQLTDEDISVLWHQSGEQPFKFARMLLK